MPTKKNDLWVIGLTGKNASGKGEAAEILKNLGYTYHSLSDILRDEANAKKLEPSREVLIRLGQELRTKEGPGTLALRTIPKLNRGKFVVDSIRNPEEISILRKHGTFKLLGLDAPIQIRFVRAQTRGRAENANTLKEFEAIENRERSNNPLSQQLDHCLKQVDRLIQNDGTLDRLKTKITTFLQDIDFS